MSGAPEAAVRRVLAAHPQNESALIQILLGINRELGYLPADGLKLVAETLAIPLARVFAAATFYKAFSLTPRGRNVIRVCLGTACHIRGGQQIVEEFSRLLAIAPGATTADREYTLETVNCLGACAMAPLVAVNEDYHGNLRIDEVRKLVSEESGCED